MTPIALNVRELLSSHHLDPHKGLGQNFLIDQGALQKIVKIAGLSGKESVLEIGAGLGSLTRLLAASSKHVVAVEIDRKLVPILKGVWPLQELFGTPPEELSLPKSHLPRRDPLGICLRLGF